MEIQVEDCPPIRSALYKEKGQEMKRAHRDVRQAQMRIVRKMNEVVISREKVRTTRKWAIGHLCDQRNGHRPHRTGG